jgi:hypothetical protein
MGRLERKELFSPILEKRRDVEGRMRLEKS